MREITENGKAVLNRRYLMKDDKGNVIETPQQLFQRVAEHVANAERLYPTAGLAESVTRTQQFFQIMSDLDFLPNSPTLMNAGRPLGQLSACFVLPIEDTMDDIFTTLKNAAMIHKSGGGTGFSFSRIRPAGARVKTTNGKASGPLSFIEAFNTATGTVAQGGCFVGETLVMTSEGPVPIMRLKAGMQVMSMGHDGKVCYTPCTDPFLTRREVSVVSVGISSGTIVCTPDHPFMVEYRQADTGGEFIYKKAIELQPGDTVISRLIMVDDRNKVNTGGKAKSDITEWSDVETVPVEAITMQASYRDVWNVEVPGTHNYAVCTFMSMPRCAQRTYCCTFVSNTRRGANMGLLRVDHPDIKEFIRVKEDLTKLTNFNLSVGITDVFMQAMMNHENYDLVDPHTGEIVDSIPAREIWDMIVHSAWKCGEPGMIFLDKVNANNFLKPLYGDIEGTNPCKLCSLQGSTVMC